MRRFPAAQGGTAATEFAFVLPILVLLAGGIVEFGRAFQVYNAVNRLATQYAIAYSDCSDYPVGSNVCLTEIGQYGDASAVRNIVPQLDYSKLTLTMFQISMNGSNPQVVYAYPPGTTLSAGQRTAAQAAFTSGQSGVIVSASYAHTLAFFPSIMSGFLTSRLTPAYTVTQLKS